MTLSLLPEPGFIPGETNLIRSERSRFIVSDHQCPYSERP